MAKMCGKGNHLPQFGGCFWKRFKTQHLLFSWSLLVIRNLIALFLLIVGNLIQFDDSCQHRGRGGTVWNRREYVCGKATMGNSR